MMFAFAPIGNIMLFVVFFPVDAAFRLQPREMFQIAPNSIYVNKFN